MARRQATENPARVPSAPSVKGPGPGGAAECRESRPRHPHPQVPLSRPLTAVLFSPLDAEPPPNVRAQGPGPPTSPTLSEKKADAFQQ